MPTKRTAKPADDAAVKAAKAAEAAARKDVAERTDAKVVGRRQAKINARNLARG